MSLTCRLFCCLVYDHPNDKTAEWRISFVHKRTLFWKLFAFLQSIWCEIDACSRLFGLVCYRPNKKTAEIHGFILYLIRFDLEIIHQWEICWLFPFFFFNSSVSLFSLSLFCCSHDLAVFSFGVWLSERKKQPLLLKKRKNSLLKMFAVVLRRNANVSRMFVCFVCDRRNKKKNSQYSLLHFGLKFV